MGGGTSFAASIVTAGIANSLGGLAEKGINPDPETVRQLIQLPVKTWYVSRLGYSIKRSSSMSSFTRMALRVSVLPYLMLSFACSNLIRVPPYTPK
jgi:hypothetical protein